MYYKEFDSVTQASPYISMIQTDIFFAAYASDPPFVLGKFFFDIKSILILKEFWS